MHCQKCKNLNGLTIRGLCAYCAPELHARHAAQMQVVADTNAAFKAATGKDSLEDWYGYERWLESPELPIHLKKAFVAAFSEGEGE